MNNNKGLIAAIVIIVLAVAAYFAFGKKDDNTTDTPVNQTQNENNGSNNSGSNNNNNNNAGTNPDVKTGEVMIDVTSAGFSPAQVTVKKGTKVTFVNKDTKSVWPASAPHPTHTDFSAFDPKAGVAAGASWSFTFDQVGAWPYHDHLFPSHFGKVTVVE